MGKPLQLYIIASEYERVKIGITESPQRRLQLFQDTTHEQLQLAYFTTLAYSNARTIETIACQILRRYRVRGEWFKTTPEIAKEAIDKAIRVVTEGNESEYISDAKTISDKKYLRVTANLNDEAKELLRKVQIKLDNELGKRVSASETFLIALRALCREKGIA
jgi:predicted GIY-YIG superfamily endonuclease